MYADRPSVLPVSEQPFADILGHFQEPTPLLMLMVHIRNHHRGLLLHLVFLVLRVLLAALE